MHLIGNERGGRVKTTKSITFDEKVYNLMKTNQYVRLEVITGNFDDAQDDMESHDDDTSGTADTSNFQPTITNKCGRNEASLALEEENNISSEYDLNGITLNESGVVHTSRYAQQIKKFLKRFTIISLICVHDDDETTTREAFSCSDNLSQKKGMHIEIKSVEHVKCSDVVSKSNITKFLHTSLNSNQNGTSKV